MSVGEDSSQSAVLSRRVRVTEDCMMVTSKDSDQKESQPKDLGNLKLLYCGFISGLVQAGNLIPDKLLMVLTLAYPVDANCETVQWYNQTATQSVLNNSTP